MSTTNFVKMHGLGNDFVVIDARKHTIDLNEDRARHIADRRTGVGCDQLISIEPATNRLADAFMRVRNADGGIVETCGNGLRCIADLLMKESGRDHVVIETMAGLIDAEAAGDGRVSVDMGAPDFDPAHVPFDITWLAPRAADAGLALWPVELGEGRTVDLAVLSMGNPHAVQIVAEVDAAPVATQGPRIEKHVRFAQGVNAGFMQVVSRTAIRLRVWERGAGETLACGTGACAAVAAGIRLGLLDPKVDVATHGGALTIEWQGGSAPVLMTGPAETVYEGEIEL